MIRHFSRAMRRLSRRTRASSSCLRTSACHHALIAVPHVVGCQGDGLGWLLSCVTTTSAVDVLTGFRAGAGSSRMPGCPGTAGRGSGTGHAASGGGDPGCSAAAGGLDEDLPEARRGHHSNIRQAPRMRLPMMPMVRLIDGSFLLGTRQAALRQRAPKAAPTPASAPIRWATKKFLPPAIRRLAMVHQTTAHAIMVLSRTISAATLSFMVSPWWLPGPAGPGVRRPDRLEGSQALEAGDSGTDGSVVMLPHETGEAMPRGMDGYRRPMAAAPDSFRAPALGAW